MYLVGTSSYTFSKDCYWLYNMAANCVDSHQEGDKWVDDYRYSWTYKVTATSPSGSVSVIHDENSSRYMMEQGFRFFEKDTVLTYTITRTGGRNGSLYFGGGTMIYAN